MTNQTAIVLVAFDIELDQRRRRRVARELLSVGHRVQRSVFECALSAEDERRLRRRIERWTTPEDSVLYWRLPNSSRIRSLGPPPDTAMRDVPFLVL